MRRSAILCLTTAAAAFLARPAWAETPPLVASAVIEADAVDPTVNRLRLNRTVIEADAIDPTVNRLRLNRIVIEADAVDPTVNRLRLNRTVIEADAGFPEVPDDTVPPTVRIDAPRDGDTVGSDTLTVAGAAFDLAGAGETTNFRRYTLALAPANAFPLAFTTLVTSETAVESGLLGVLDLGGFSNGPHVLRLRAEDRSFNVAETSVRIVLARPLADLVVTDDAILLSDTNPDPAETVTVTVVVENVGAADASNVEVALLLDGARVGTAFIPSIPFATSTETVVFEVAATREGLAILTAVVDPADLIPEQSEIGNLATRSFLVGEAFPGLILVDAVVEPEVVTAGGGVRVKGNARYNPAYSVGGPVSGACVAIFYQGLDPTNPLNAALREKVFAGRTLDDGSFDVAVEAPVDSGTFTLAVTVTDHTATGLRTTDFGVVAPTGPDLLVRTSGPDAVRDNFGILRQNEMVDLSFDRQPIEGGAAVTFTSRLWNVGRADAAGVEYRWSLDGAQVKFDTIPFIAGNGGFADVAVAIAFPAGSGGAFHVLTLQADPDNNIPDEFREGNNMGAKTLYVGLPAFDTLGDTPR